MQNNTMSTKSISTEHTNTNKQLANKQLVLTTPIFYPNAAPHIGHAYTCVVTDFLARYYKNKGYDVLFSTGLDEHGQKIARTAEKKGITPQEHVDEMAEIFQTLMSKYNIGYSTFIRTTSAKHKKAVQVFWKHLEANGYIYLNKYTGWYDISDEAFVKEGEIDPKTKTTNKAKTYQGKEVILIEEECYFFKLSAFQEAILKHYQAHPEAIYPHTRLNEVLGFLKQDLNDIAISRTTISWGVKVPEGRKLAFQKCIEYIMQLLAPKKQHVIYVWIDALVNYLTILGYPFEDVESDHWPSLSNSDDDKLDNLPSLSNSDDDKLDSWPSLSNSDKSNKVIPNKVIHIIGKDILKFHAIYWLGFLFGAKLSAPKEILTHGWWLINDDKMSKSTGNIVDPFELVDKYGCDQMRWFFMREMIFGDDANFSMDQLHTRCNELSNVIGNLVQRSISLLHKKHQGVICNPEDVLCVNDVINVLDKHICDRKIHLYAHTILDFASQANQYFDHAQPWKDDETSKFSSLQVLSNVMHIIYHLGVMLKPLLPESAEKILNAFTKVDKDKGLSEGMKIEQIGILFPRLQF